MGNVTQQERVPFVVERLEHYKKEIAEAPAFSDSIWEAYESEKDPYHVKTWQEFRETQDHLVERRKVVHAYLTRAGADAVAKQLAQLDQEISDAIAVEGKAMEAYENATEPELKCNRLKRLKRVVKENEVLATQRGALQAALQSSRASAHQPEDMTVAYPKEVMENMHRHPPSYDSLTDELRLLSKPLPMTPANLADFPLTSPAVNELVVSTLDYPAATLGQIVGVTLRRSGYTRHGRNLAIIVADMLINGLMTDVLEFMGFNCRNHDDNTVEPCRTLAAAKRPDAQLFMQSVLMFKGEAKAGAWEFEEARTQLTSKMATWSTEYHGTREYMVCFASAGHRLRFYAVTRGGHHIKPISPEFDLRRDLDHLKVMHTTIYALTSVLQQAHHQLPTYPQRDPLPFGIRVEHKGAVLYYMGEYLEKRVETWRYRVWDEDTLLRIYKVLLELPSGPKLSHHPGLIRPLGMPTLVSEIWEVRVPLGRPSKPDRDQLRTAIKDILQGLDALHKEDIVHRDIQWGNVLEMSNGEYVLIDFELSGMADAVPQFHPLLHWAPECHRPDTPYTTAADIYAVGALTRGYSAVEADTVASSLCNQMMAEDAAQRPTASEALGHPWIQGASCPLVPIQLKDLWGA